MGLIQATEETSTDCRELIVPHNTVKREVSNKRAASFLQTFKIDNA